MGYRNESRCKWPILIFSLDLSSAAKRGNRRAVIVPIPIQYFVLFTVVFQCRELAQLHERFGDKAEFLLVYQREAHAIDSPRPGEYQVVEDPIDDEERRALAKRCLAELGLPAQARVLSLVAFNVGIELAQLAFVALLLLPLERLARLPSYEKRIVRGNASDELGWYVKLGYQAGSRESGFFVEALHRFLDVTIDEIQIDPFMRILRKLPTVPTCEEREAEEEP